MESQKKFIYTIIKEHPLDRNKWMVFTPSLPFIPPYIGTKKECIKARENAENSAKKYFNQK